MKFPYSKREISRIGEIIANSKDHTKIESCLEVVEEWRSIHEEPLNFMMELAQDVSNKYDSSIVVGRLKRTETIIDKLRRPNTSYDLKALDDIAGCRIIMPDASCLFEVSSDLKTHPSFYRIKDYITFPKNDGYRCIHSLHRWNSRKYEIEGLRGEIQVRSRIQHSWSTAVEAYDSIARSKLKSGFSNLTEKRFFSIASALMAIFEKDMLDLTISDDITGKLKKELREIEEESHIVSKLKGFCESVTLVDLIDASDQEGLYLIRFDSADQTISLNIYSLLAKEDANREYAKFEKEASSSEVVLLVQSSSIENLQAGYPNYFSDISLFVDTMKKFLDN